MFECESGLGVDDGEVFEGEAVGVFGGIEAVDGDDGIDNRASVAGGAIACGAVVWAVVGATAPASAATWASLDDLDGELLSVAEAILLPERQWDEGVVFVEHQAIGELSDSSFSALRPLENACDGHHVVRFFNSFLGDASGPAGSFSAREHTSASYI